MILKTLGNVTLAPEDILAILQDEHRHQSSYDPGANPDQILTLESSIEDWRIACDLVEWKTLAAALNEQWNLSVPLSEWKEILTPPKKRKLQGVCEVLSRSNRPKMVIVPTIFGCPCPAAGVFFAVRELLERAGADVSHLTPSSLLSNYSMEHSRIFERDISQLAPGSLPAIEILNPDYERADGFLTLAILCFFGSVLVSFWVAYLWVPFLIVVLCSIAWVNHVARYSKPKSVRFGELKTMRDLCRTLASGLRTQQTNTRTKPIDRSHLSNFTSVCSLVVAVIARSVVYDYA